MVLIVLSLRVNTRVGKLRTTGGKMARASGHFLNSIKRGERIMLSSSANVTVLGWQEQGQCFRVNDRLINTGKMNVAFFLENVLIAAHLFT